MMKTYIYLYEYFFHVICKYCRLLCSLQLTNNLVVVEKFWDKSPHSNIFSLSESVHPLVPQKKVSMNCSWAKVFRALWKGRFFLFSSCIGKKGGYKIMSAICHTGLATGNLELLTTLTFHLSNRPKPMHLAVFFHDITTNKHGLN